MTESDDVYTRTTDYNITGLRLVGNQQFEEQMRQVMKSKYFINLLK